MFREELKELVNGLRIDNVPEFDPKDTIFLRSYNVGWNSALDSVIQLLEIED